MRLENTMLNHMTKAGALCTLAVLTACSGGGGSSSSSASTSGATSITYTDPAPSASQWTLVKDPASTSGHLVLDLVPPADGGSGFGIGFTISAPAGLTWSKPYSGDAQPLHNSAYALGSGTQLIKAVSKNADLIAGMFQKGLGPSPAPHNTGSVGSIALDLTTGAARVASASLTVKVAQELRSDGLQPVAISSGSIALH